MIIVVTANLSTKILNKAKIKKNTLLQGLSQLGHLLY